MGIGYSDSKDLAVPTRYSVLYSGTTSSPHTHTLTPSLFPSPRTRSPYQLLRDYSRTTHQMHSLDIGSVGSFCKGVQVPSEPSSYVFCLDIGTIKIPRITRYDPANAAMCNEWYGTRR
jgi:hypothetical protein